MLRSRTTRAAAFGFVLYWVGVGWAMLHGYVAKRHDPPGWIVDRGLYQPAVILSWIGVLVFLIASAVGIAGWTYRRIRSALELARVHRSPVARNMK
jgi:hypothetical protein